MRGTPTVRTGALLLAAVLALAAAPAEAKKKKKAPPPKGPKIGILHGGAKLQAPADTRWWDVPVARELKAGERVKSGKGGEMVLVFPDGGLLRLLAGGEFLLEELTHKSISVVIDKGEAELWLELPKKKTFSEADEIAPTGGLWISAQTLLNRDGDEFTQTCTRNTAVTQATHSNTETPVVPGSQQVTPEELTPTPENAIPLNTAPPIKRTSQPQTRPFNSKVFPIIGGMAIITALWLLVNHLKPTSPDNNVPEESAKTSSQPIARSPFVREMYRLIHSGQTGTALEKLTQSRQRFKF